MCAKWVSNIPDCPYCGRPPMKKLHLLGVKRFSFTSIRYVSRYYWLRFAFFRFDSLANTSFASVCSAEEFDSPESETLCFRLNCIAKFVVFPHLKVAAFLWASLKPQCLQTGDRKVVWVLKKPFGQSGKFH